MGGLNNDQVYTECTVIIKFSNVMIIYVLHNFNVVLLTRIVSILSFNK